MTHAPNGIAALFEQVGLQVRFRSNAKDLWNRVHDRLAYAPVAYSGPMIDYYLAYMRGQHADVSDVSVMVLNDGNECGLWPLLLAAPSALGLNGAALVPPLFMADVANSTRKRIIAQCLEFLDAFLRANAATRWDSSEAFSGTFALSEWHDRAMKRGCTAALRQEMFVDLSLDLAGIKSHVRKSYRPLISAAERLWSVAVLDCKNDAVWTQFRELHAFAAGRQTRSAETWELQHTAIECGSAFLVYLSDPAGRMVGAGLFHLTRDESLYAVGAYDRQLFDKPLGHLVQFRAIQELLNRHVRWHKLGVRNYPSERPAPTPKELSIADFKQGFATHLLPKYELTFELR